MRIVSCLVKIEDPHAAIIKLKSFNEGKKIKKNNLTKLTGWQTTVSNNNELAVN